MKSRTILILAAAVLWSASCDRHRIISPEPDLPSEIAKFMGTTEERANRAPYSPPGWPLKRGEVVTLERFRELGRQFPGLHSGIASPLWVGDKVFGAVWRGDRATRKPDGSLQHHTRYMGHFPVKRRVPFRLSELPRHLRGRDLDEINALLYEEKFSTLEIDVEAMRVVWTEERWLAGYFGEGR